MESMNSPKSKKEEKKIKKASEDGAKIPTSAVEETLSVSNSSK